MKVLQCIRQGQVGGGETHLLTLLAHLDRERFLPTVLSFTDGPMVDKLQTMGVDTKVIFTTRPFDITKWRRIRRWMQQQNFKLVHAHGTRAQSNIVWAARSLGIPVIYTIHGWSFHDDQKKWVKTIRVWGESVLTRLARLNISVSQNNQLVGAKYLPGFQSVVVQNGIDVQRFSQTIHGANLRTQLDIPQQAVVLLFMGRLTHQKQPLGLLEAFDKQAQQNPLLYLVMAGEGDQQAAVEAAYKNAVHKDRIRLLPFRNDVEVLLHGADVFVLPSLWEGLPIALLEAMAAGKAIIASAVDGTKELLQHGENGWLIDPMQLKPELEKAIAVLAADVELRKTLGLNAGKTIHGSYEASTMTRRIEDLYLQVTNNN